MTNIDLNDFSGGPHWLSFEGNQGRRSAIRAKHRAAWEATHPRPRNPVKPHTAARLERIVMQAKDAETVERGRTQAEVAGWNSHRAKHQQQPGDNREQEPTENDHLQAWSKAIIVLDASEVLVRDLIERELSGIAGEKMSFAVLDRVVRRLMKKITLVREHAIKVAFRLIRTRLGNGPILGVSLGTWAHSFLRSDLENINTTIRTALIQGLDNTEIARKVVGSMSLNGVDGVTEYTRHKIGHLGRAAIKQIMSRKTGLPSA